MIFDHLSDLGIRFVAAPPHSIDVVTARVRVTRTAAPIVHSTEAVIVEWD